MITLTILFLLGNTVVGDDQNHQQSAAKLPGGTVERQAIQDEISRVRGMTIDELTKAPRDRESYNPFYFHEPEMNLKRILSNRAFSRLWEHVEKLPVGDRKAFVRKIWEEEKNILSGPGESTEFWEQELRGCDVGSYLFLLSQYEELNYFIEQLGWNSERLSLRYGHGYDDRQFIRYGELEVNLIMLALAAHKDPRLAALRELVQKLGAKTQRLELGRFPATVTVFDVPKLSKGGKGIDRSQGIREIDAYYWERGGLEEFGPGPFKLRPREKTAIKAADDLVETLAKE